MPTRLALIVTCFNRRERSVRSIGEFLRQGQPRFDTRAFVTDDASSDGTADALRALGDRVSVEIGTGDLFWAGGMRAASARAEAWGADWYVWLNDDLELATTALDDLAAAIDGADPSAPAVFVGQLVDPDSGAVSYGGRVRARRSPISFPLTTPDSGRCDTFNGNFLAFSRGAYARLGGFPQHFHHGYADFVMGLRTSRAGIPITILERPVGTGAMNPATGKMFRRSVPLRRRIAFALSPFGLPPSDHLRFLMEAVGPVRGARYFFTSYLRVLLPPPEDEIAPTAMQA